MNPFLKISLLSTAFALMGYQAQGQGQGQNQGNCDAPISIVVENGLTSLCPGQPATIIAISAPPNTTQIWKKDGVLLKSCTCGSLNIDQPGRYSVANKYPNGCVSPEVALTINPGVNCGSTPTPGASINASNLGSYVGINVSNTGQSFGNNAGGPYSLAVNGRILAQEVRVRTGWADYVFSASYPLRSLTRVESFVRKYHHLPGVPSAAQVEQEGIQIGQMNAVLLSKIEELTLYVIQQQKQLAHQQQQIRQLQKRSTTKRK